MICWALHRNSLRVFFEDIITFMQKIKGAVQAYIADVRSQDFPNEKEQY